MTAVALVAAIVQTGAEDGEIAYWTCGMHPSVKSDEPGKCPICNMDLVPVEREKETDEKILYWTCGMHPSVKSDEPGKCPIWSELKSPKRCSIRGPRKANL